MLVCNVLFKGSLFLYPLPRLITPFPKSSASISEACGVALSSFKRLSILMIAFLLVFSFWVFYLVLHFVQVEVGLSNSEFEISYRPQTTSQWVKVLSLFFIEGYLIHGSALPLFFLWVCRYLLLQPGRRSAPCLSPSLAYAYVSCTGIFGERNEFFSLF